MPAVGSGAGATYGAGCGGTIGAAIGGGARGGGAGGSFGAHAATSAKADAMIIGLANCTTALSYRVATHLNNSWAFHSTKRKERARACFRVARDYRAKLACPAGSFVTECDLTPRRTVLVRGMASLL